MTAVAMEGTSVWELRRMDLDSVIRKAPSFAQRIRAFVEDGEAVAYLTKRQRFDADKSARWRRAALRCLDTREPLPAAADMTPAHRQNKGAPIAIFLGITLDGIPESLVIGASTIHSTVSVSLIVGLFLANYPEALSSSMGMRQQGFPFRWVLVMWSALMVITGAGAAAGSLLLLGAEPDTFALIEGLAAGAMLTMIAETMLPEAYLKGGSVVGLSTLFGFLIAIFSKTLEPSDADSAHHSGGAAAPPALQSIEPGVAGPSAASSAPPTVDRLRPERGPSMCVRYPSYARSADNALAPTGGTHECRGIRHRCMSHFCKIPVAFASSRHGK
jgi:hypothetical protein